MTAARKLSKVAQAYERCKPARDALHSVGRCMETTEDKCGIVWERWVIVRDSDCVSVLLYATADGWDVFAPLSRDATIDGTVAAIKALA
jgi:hypothetical protein